jgi:hypothetical protein
MKLWNAIVLLFLLASAHVNAQRAELFGKVQSGAGGNPLEFAIVTVNDNSGKLCGGCITKSDGTFEIELDATCAKRITIKMIGFISYENTINLKANSKHDLGNIRLEPNVELLKEIEITSSKDPFKIGIDKRIYYPDQDAGARGGTAIDALKSIPGITVGADQSVQLRNQAPTIFVDGQPSMLSIDQIPADEIERIEIITNPSAKYVADASGGILNIIMKRNLKPGYFGRVNASLGTNNRYGLNTSFSIREKKLLLQFAGGFFNARNYNNGFSKRDYLNSQQESGLKFDLDNFNVTDKFNYNFNFKGEYKTGIRSALRLNYGFSPNYSEVNESQQFENRNAADSVFLAGFRTNFQENNWTTHTSGLSYRYDSPKPGKALSADFTFISSSNRNNFNFNNYARFNGQLYPGEYQENRGSREADFGIFQLDYSSCDTLDTRIEAGLRAAYKQSFSNFDVQTSPGGQAELLPDTSLSNAFRVDDFVGAAYLSVTGKLGSWGWQVGLRFEDTYFKAEEQRTGETYSFIYPKNWSELDKALFPSVYLSRMLGDKLTLQINYSRKIARPGYMQLIPFITYADRQLVQIGNPVLAPSFLNIGEINSSFRNNDFSMYQGIYVRYEKGAITNVIFPSQNDPSVLISTYANGRDQYSGGLENNFRYRFGKHISTNLSGTLFYTKVALQSDSAAISNQGWSWNARLMLQYQAGEKWQFQINGNYEAPRIIPQGVILPVQFMDLSISYTAGKKSNFTCTLSDVFNSKRFGTRIESDLILQETYRRWETRYMRISYTYQFGEPGKSLFRSRNTGKREPGNKGTEMQEL